VADLPHPAGLANALDAAVTACECRCTRRSKVLGVSRGRGKKKKMVREEKKKEKQQQQQQQQSSGWLVACDGFDMSVAGRLLVREWQSCKQSRMCFYIGSALRNVGRTAAHRVHAQHECHVPPCYTVLEAPESAIVAVEHGVGDATGSRCSAGEWSRSISTPATRFHTDSSQLRLSRGQHDQHPPTRHTHTHIHTYALLLITLIVRGVV
jgi:hypothetical protein